MKEFFRLGIEAEIPLNEPKVLVKSYVNAKTFPITVY